MTGKAADRHFFCIIFNELFIMIRSGSVSGGMGNISACGIGNADSADQNPAAITGQNMKIQIAGSINPNPDAMTVLGGSIGFKPLTFFAVGISMNGVNYGSMTAVLGEVYSAKYDEFRKTANFSIFLVLEQY